jgi:hypothetical protein
LYLGTDNRFLQEFIMDEKKLPSIDTEQLKQLLKEDFDACISDVVRSIDTAAVGSIIDDSEEAVRAAAGRFRQKIFEKALQMKMDAADAAFPPSEERGR